MKFPNISFKFKMNIGGRLALGFAAVAVVLAVAVGLTLFKVESINARMQRIAELRVPTADASSAIVNNINASLANLRGWMLTGNEVLKQGRAIVWDDFVDRREQMDELSQQWTKPEIIAKWTGSNLFSLNSKSPSSRLKTSPIRPRSSPQS